ncbi:hypothetical protein BDN70DRAFT_939116 [Pholiota conissans]|uniref:DUF4218 domain-containing protein n=1 Tax=Pholiota conissans TaxID=109636 RepID=A0A9P5YP97_9AGAR|nr:hypothetical protein BDN70DRAFT_939116 [Pholiota conissans]
MSLVSAVTIASSRTTSCKKADLYLRHMQDYLKAIRDIFPNYKYLLNQYMALHLAEYLHLYGPVHAWWTFPFERLIGMLQRILNNFQDGQLEETISNSFTKSANLRSLLLKDGCPAAIKNCEGYFTKLVDPQIRNTLLTDIARFSSVLEDVASDASNVITADSKSRKTVISGPTHQALRTYYADIGVGKIPNVEKIMSSYTATGLTFSSSTKHAGNSLVLLHSPSQGSSVPAQIENIIQVSSTEVLFAVRYFLKTTADDPFKQYPIIQASLWSEHRRSLAIATLQDVEAHFACLNFEWDNAPCIAAISLLREY